MTQIICDKKGAKIFGELECYSYLCAQYLVRKTRNLRFVHNI